MEDLSFQPKTLPPHAVRGPLQEGSESNWVSTYRECPSFHNMSSYMEINWKHFQWKKRKGLVLAGFPWATTIPTWMLDKETSGFLKRKEARFLFYAVQVQFHSQYWVESWNLVLNALINGHQHPRKIGELQSKINYSSLRNYFKHVVNSKDAQH